MPEGTDNFDSPGTGRPEAPGRPDPVGSPDAVATAVRESVRPEAFVLDTRALEPGGREPGGREPGEPGGCGKCGGTPACTKAIEVTVVPLLSTGDLARHCETTVRTVRFYEEAGLIEPDQRSDGGHRMFRPDQLAKLQLIMDLREAGLSLQDIKALFELKKGCPSAEQASTEMAEALEAQIACMTKKIAVLRRLREELASMVSAIRECAHCDHHEFHAKCDGCDVMQRPELPRAMRLLWSSKG